MFDAPLISDAHAAAAAAAPGGGLEAETIMAVVGGIVSGIVLGLGALFYRHGHAPPPKRAATTADAVAALGEGTQLFLQGPASDVQAKLAAALVLLEKLAALHYETREQIATGLQITRHDLRGALGEDALQASRESNEIRALVTAIAVKVDDLNLTLGRLDEFVRARSTKR
jgi:phage-related tail protein